VILQIVGVLMALEVRFGMVKKKNVNISWKDNDVVGFAIDLDGMKKSFHVCVNGEWKNVFEDMHYSGGLWPAVTSDGHYHVNFGDEKMKFGPPNDEYRTVVDAMKHQSLVEDICSFTVKTHQNSESKEDTSEINDNDKIFAKDRLIFTDVTMSMKESWSPTVPKFVRLKPTRMEKLKDEEDAREVTDAIMHASGNVVRVRHYNDLGEDDIEVAISSTALHFLVSEGISSPEEMEIIIDAMEQLVTKKDEIGRMPIEIAAQKGNNVLAMKLWEKMVKMKEGDLHLAMKAGLWKICADLFEKEKQKGDENFKRYLKLPDSPGTLHAVHYAAQYDATMSIWQTILDTDKSLIKLKGDNERNIFHYLAEVNAPAETIEVICDYFKAEGETYSSDLTDLFSAKEEQTLMLPLHYATACRANEKLLEKYVLLSSQANNDGKEVLLEKDVKNLMPIHWALHYDEKFCKSKIVGDVGTIKFLLEKYSKIKSHEVNILEETVDFDYEGITYPMKPLHFALASNLTTKEIVEELIFEAELKDENLEDSTIQKTEDTKNSSDYALHLAARCITNRGIVQAIANHEKYKKDIVLQYKGIGQSMTPLHFAAKYNKESDIVKCLLEIEHKYIFETRKKEIDSDPDPEKKTFDDRDKLSMSSISKIDEKGYLPIHHAASARFGTAEIIDNLIKYYKELDKQSDSKGGADKTCHLHSLPLHIAIEADAYRSKITYSSIILQLIEKYENGVTKKQDRAPLRVALDPSKPRPQRLKKLTEEVIEKMLLCYENAKNIEIPKDVDLSFWCSVNDEVFKQIADDFINVFDKSTSLTPNFGNKLSHRYPQLFKGTGLINTDNPLKWKYWFVLHASIFECVEKIKIHDRDIAGGLEDLVNRFNFITERDIDFKKYPIKDIPIGNILNGQEDPSKISEWLDPILQKVDDEIYSPEPSSNKLVFPHLTSPLGYAVRNGCTRAIIALSKGGCDPVKDCFPVINKKSFYINSYEIANFAGTRLQREKRSQWEKGMNAMRQHKQTVGYRNAKALGRLWSFRKLPLEIFTLVLFVAIGVLTTTGMDTQQLRFGNHISEKFVDEEFDPDDSHIEKNFFDIATVDEFWQWIDGPLYGGLYPGNNLYINGRPALDEVSVVVGSIRIRQVRAKKVKCRNQLNVDISSLPVGGCHRDKVDTKGSFETLPFGPNNKYTYSEPKGILYENVLLGDRLWNQRYLRGGYIVELPGANATRALEILTKLKNDNYVSVVNGTRLIVIDFNVYNSHIDRVAAMRLMVEFWVGGGTHANLDVTLLEWDGPADYLQLALLQNVLLAIFVLRFLVEIDEMAWETFYSIARRVKQGDTTGSISHSGRMDFTTIKMKGFHLGEFSWEPMKCCTSRHRASRVEPDRTLYPLLTTFGSEKKEKKDGFGTSIQVALAANKFKDGKSGHKTGYMARSNSIYENVSNSPYFVEKDDKNQMARNCKKSFDGVLAAIQVECFVIWHFISFAGLFLILKLANGSKSPQKHVASKDKDNQPKSVPYLGENHTYNKDPFRMWWRVTSGNRYFRHYWNYYEWMLIVGYGVYYTLATDSEMYKKMVRPQLIDVLKSGEETYVPLDKLSWSITESQDYVALLFILLSIHLLSVMQEMPYGVGERVMAILKVFYHKDIAPFYFTLLVILFSFAIGFHFAYANEISDYRNLWSSILNILFASFGDFGIGVEEMQDSTQTIAYILIVILILLVSLVLMNIFIGVVSTVYDKTEAESIYQFDQDLDEYMRDGMSEDARSWSRTIMYQETF
jgi:hypothetical protein